MFHRCCIRRRHVRALLPALIALTLLIAVPCSAAAQEGPAATTDIAPEPPVLSSPIDGADITATNYPPLAMPTLRWLPAAGATIYHVQISDSPGFSTIVKETDTYGIDYTPTDVYQDGSYYWRVKAGAKNKTTDWSAYSEAFSFNKNWSNDENNRPSPISPVGGVTRSAFPAEDFSWTPSPGAAGYKLEIATDQQFGNIVYSAETVKPHHAPLERFAANTYYWRVTPFAYYTNSSNRVNGSASETATFQFAWNAPPQLIEPPAAVGGQTPELRFVPRFSWTAVEGAKDYQIDISTDQSFGTSVTSYATRNTDFTPINALSNDSEYFWRVKARNAEDFSTPFSEVRRFRAKWNIAPKLQAPANNRIHVSYPFFTWEPVPGAERYQILITDGDKTVADELIYNANTYAYPGPWQSIVYGRDYFWQVRAVDARGNNTPWSEKWSFRFSMETSPEPIYPLYYHVPDSVNMPIHEDNSIAFPVFVWDTAHLSEGTAAMLVEADRYVLTVDDDPNFASPNFSLQTTGLAAAPTLEQPLTGLTNGMLLYWRVQAYRGVDQLGVDVIWRMRYDGALAQIPVTPGLMPMFPRDGMESVIAPPVLGWQPVSGAHHYRVQVSRTPDFSQIVDEKRPQFVYYVPWQGQLTKMPSGTYWWRARAESATDSPVGDWSATRRFNLSTNIVWSNPYEFVPPTNILSTTADYLPDVTLVGTSASSTGDDYDLGDLHVMVHQTPVDFGWLIAFAVPGGISGSLQYGIYVDSDHAYNSGAQSDPGGRPITTDPYHRPEYAIYVMRTGDSVSSVSTSYHRWSGGSWQPMQTLDSIGGQVWLDPDPAAVHVLIPYSALDAASDNSVGSFAVTVFSTDGTAGDGAHDTIPPQGQYYGVPALFDNPVFVSNMVTPQYPFDTPLDNPITLYQMPPLRWRMPYYDTVDGYQVQIARDPQFSDVAETWETYESLKAPVFGLLSASAQSEAAWENNESYYWRVRIRHEKIDNLGAYTYGPWSPAMRFKLSSRLPGNPQLSTGAEVFMTPTFLWDRVEGASGYTLQIDNDANFSSPIINQALDGTSYTPQEPSSVSALLPGTQYYWRLAMRRSSTVYGQWTPTMTFQKSSVSPTPINPSQGMTVTGQPTFQWSVVLTPTVTPRLATPLYHLQVDDDPTFGSPFIDIETPASSYTPVKGKSLSDGIWYWRVALYDANSNDGPFSPTQWFAKQYLAPNLVYPNQGGTAGVVPTFQWEALPGAAYYEVSYADNPAFASSTKVTTMSTAYTTVKNMTTGRYHWYVQMFDQDKKAGPIIPRYYDFGYSLFMPVAMK